MFFNLIKNNIYNKNKNLLINNINKLYFSTNFIFNPLPTTTISIKNGLKFPVNRIFCVGRNYADHDAEMKAMNPELYDNTNKNDDNKVQPCFFMKPNTSICTNSQVPYPIGTNSLHHEIELVICLKDDGINLSIDDVDSLIYGYAVGIDLTRRDLQSQLKKKRHPWEASKAFDNSALCGTITPKEDLQDGIISPSSNISLIKNNQVVQLSTLSSMMLNYREIISSLSQLFMLKRGDLIYTGTPSGVGELVKGDQCIGHVDGLDDLEFTII